MAAVPDRRPFVLGVTGDIACGKSTVLRMLADLGATAIDADAVYHRLIEPGLALWERLVERFGPSILGSDRQIDRKALGAIVFADPIALADLDRLTHPAVIDEIQRQIATNPTEVIAVDGVKLVESGMDALCDRVWVVTCPSARQIARLIERNGLSPQEAERRIASQPPLAPKLARADLVIDNGGTLDDTRAQVHRGWRDLQLPPSNGGRHITRQVSI